MPKPLSPFDIASITAPIEAGKRAIAILQAAADAIEALDDLPADERAEALAGLADLISNQTAYTEREIDRVRYELPEGELPAMPRLRPIEATVVRPSCPEFAEAAARVYGTEAAE